MKGKGIRREGSQVDLITAHDMLGQVFDPQLQLRLADLLFATQITQIVQRIAQGAHLRFLFVHGSQSCTSFFRKRGNSLAR